MQKNEECKKPQLVVMLTYNDLTVANAEEIFEECKCSDAQIWGFKEKPLPIDRMKALYGKMKSCGKTTCLEVVAYTEDEGMEGARIAAECGCDVLMGTKFSSKIADFCRLHNIKYMPFVGTITGRPSVLAGTPEEMIAEALDALKGGAYGIDLLGYRYVGDALDLNKRITAAVPAPVCIAGSIDSYERLDEIIETSPSAFTIGSAFFNHKFGGDIKNQINSVCRYVANEPVKV